MNVCTPPSGGVLDNVVTIFATTAETWQSTLNPLAQNLFFILFGMEFMWQLTVKKIFAGDIEKLWVFFFARSVTGFFFARYLVNANVYISVIQYFVQLGSNLSGFVLNLTPNNIFVTLGPSEVMENFACLADTVHTLTDTTGIAEYLCTKFFLAISEVMLLIALAFIAYSLIKILVQTYFVLYIGFFLTGFIGSSWTQSFWYSYIYAVARVAIKFLAICFIMGATSNEMIEWAQLINTAVAAVKPYTALAGAMMHIVGMSVIMALLSYQFPEWAAVNLIPATRGYRSGTLR